MKNYNRLRIRNPIGVGKLIGKGSSRKINLKNRYSTKDEVNRLEHSNRSDLERLESAGDQP